MRPGSDHPGHAWPLREQGMAPPTSCRGTESPAMIANTVAS